MRKVAPPVSTKEVLRPDRQRSGFFLRVRWSDESRLKGVDKDKNFPTSWLIHGFDECSGSIRLTLNSRALMS
jgi:hypothetical protein